MPSALPSLGRRAAVLGGAVVLIVAAAVVTLSVLSTTQHKEQETASGPVSVTASRDECATGWQESRGGAVEFLVENADVMEEDVFLTDASRTNVYGEVESLGTNAQRHLRVVLPDGKYRFVCAPSEGDPVSGSVVTVSGAGDPSDATPGIPLLTRADLLPAAKEYHDWVVDRLDDLATRVARLDDAAHAGDLDAARSAWLSAHLRYETLGAAYDAFGDADTAINGTPAPGSTALDDPDLTGFHRIEALLWHDGAADEVAAATGTLVDDVDALREDFRSARVNAVDVGLRAHEIVEDTIQFVVPGRTDAGSHTGLATIGAQLQGARAALTPLESVLRSRYPGLDETEHWLDRTEKLVQSYRHGDEEWPAIADLDHAERAALNADLGRLVEQLAPVAAICDPRTAL